MNDTKIIFVGNYKGGVGKTTSVLNFAEHFAQKGKNVLVMDLDPQSSLSEILVKNSEGSLNKLEDNKVLNYVFDLTISKIKKYNSMQLKFSRGMVQSYHKGYDFIASSLFYREEEGKAPGIGLDELAIQMSDSIEYLSILKNYVDAVLEEKHYDYVLMDCPPSSNLITQSAFLMADYYIIPTILDGISSNGVAHYIKTVHQTYVKHCEASEEALLARHFFGKEPELIGIFCTFIRGQVNYSAAHKELVDTVQKNSIGKEIFFFEEEVNNYIDIPRSTEVGEASKARNDYAKLAESILARLDKMQEKG